MACSVVAEADVVQLLDSPKRAGQRSFEEQARAPSHALSGASVTSCLLWAERSLFRATLAEYPSPAEAAKAFAELNKAGHATVAVESGIGDKAHYWNIDKELTGYSILKGKRVLNLEASWRRGAPAAARERMRPMAQAAALKL